jgi:NAD(P)-dependent dehydrogenase (short-subunit alcohol dehydrogenase family)
MRRLLALALAPLFIYLLSAATELVLRVPFPVPDSGGAVVVTGASSGIGLAAALHLSSLGFTVYAGVRSEEAADVVRKASASAGAGLKTLYIDVAHQASVDAAAARVGSELQGHGTKLVGLIANAGVAAKSDASGAEAARAGTWVYAAVAENAFAVNVFGVLRTTEAFLPMLQRGGGGRIIITGSLAGRVHRANDLACAARHSNRIFSRALVITRPPRRQTSRASTRWRGPPTRCASSCSPRGRP